jgi:high-affinity iron transporter
MKKWRTFLEAKLKHGLTTKNYLALAIVSFLAVFRECFEVVLFLRAIWIDLDPSGQTVAGMGVLSSFVLLIGLSYLAIKESRKLPLGLLFQICSWTMVILAFVLAGKGMHSLQEAGLVSVTQMPLNVRFDLLGVYPSVQTMAVQLFIAALFGFLFYADARNKMLARNNAVAEN